MTSKEREQVRQVVRGAASVWTDLQINAQELLALFDALDEAEKALNKIGNRVPEEDRNSIAYDMQQIACAALVKIRGEA